MILENLHKINIFRKEDVAVLLNSENAAKELLRRYKKSGLIAQIRRNLYVVTDLASKAATANKFEIGSNVSNVSYIAYHAALEYHGLATQIFNTVYVADNRRFRSFIFEGVAFKFCQSKISQGVVKPVFNSLVRVSNLERTLVDCIDNIGLAGGLEEFVLALALVTLVKENLLWEYLRVYNKQVLYQKAGFIFSYFNDKLRLSEDFFEDCKAKIGQNVSFLTDDGSSTVFFTEWKLYAPENILEFLEQGGGENV